MRSARVVGQAPRLAGARWRMVGQDGGQSIPLKKGLLFVFADTLLAPADMPVHLHARELIEGRTGVFLGNCAAVAKEASSLLEAMSSLDYLSDEWGRPRELLETTALERLAGWRLWPQHGIALRDKVYLYYIAIKPGAEGGLWDYEHQGTGLAVIDLARGTCDRLRWADEWRFWPEIPGTVHLGVQVLRVETWVYVFASRQDGLEFRAFVCRVREEAFENPGSYEFLQNHLGNGAACWGRDWRESLTLGECGREFSVSWNAFLGAYLMVYLDPFGRSLQMRLAEQPYGPFGPPVAVTGSVPTDPRTELVSLGFEHPQYAA